MLSWGILLVLGWAAIGSDGGRVGDWVNDPPAWLSKEGLGPAVIYPEGNYLAYGPKEIVWQKPPTVLTRRPPLTPGGRTTAASLVPSTQGGSATPASARSSRDRISGQGNINRSAGGTNQLEDLGILGQPENKSGASADEILAFFEKTSTRSDDTDRSSTVLAPVPVGTNQVEAKSEATFTQE